MSSTGKYLAVGLVVLVLAIAGWWWMAAVSAQKSSARWASLSQAKSEDDLNALIKNAAGTKAARDARFMKARLLLNRGQKSLYSEKHEDALKDIKAAGAEYEKLAEESGNFPVLGQEALQAAAFARLVQDDKAGALSFYRKLAQRYPKSESGAEAQEITEEKLEEALKVQQQLAEKMPKKSPAPETK